ncbi:MAG: VPS10 domain-containing protein [Gemmataceae bacterium]
MNVHRMNRISCLFVLTALSALICIAATRGDETKSDPSPFKRLKFRSIGPAAGGRVCRVAGVPGDPLTCYAATAASGLWKSSDGGIHWKPIADDLPTSTFGSLAIAPSDPNVIYAGSGEANIRGNIEVGNGIYKSSDAGKTWKHVWKQEGQIGTMIVHPTNPDLAFAAVLGHAFGANAERGVYRTTDGGKNWRRVLFKDADTGAADVCFDPSNPKILFAGLWQARRRPWELVSGGPGSGLYVSRDGGDSWTQLIPAPTEKSSDFGKDAPKGKKYAKGLPEGIWGKIGVGVAPSEGRRVYVLIEADKGGLFRSDDGGDTWKLVNDWRAIRQRAFYYTTLTIDPRNPDVVWCPQVPLLKSIDGGKTFDRVKGPHHGDHHDIWIDPKDPRRILNGNDGGVDISTNGGETWFAPPLPWGQFYHISVDNRLPYHVAGTMQDIGTGSGPSNSLSRAGIAPSDWHPVGGGETGFTASDPTNPDIVYAGEYGGYISRYDHRTRQARNIGVYPFNPSGHDPANLKYRFQWTAPILISPHDHRVVYHGANVLFKTSDAGKNWTPISPDLTRNDKSKQKWSGGPITGDNTGVEVYGTIYALAESPKERGVLWAGSDDGLVHVSRDGGREWSNVTPRPQTESRNESWPEGGTVRCIEASPFDAGAAYVVVDAHKLDDHRPYLFQTKDYGKNWHRLEIRNPKSAKNEDLQYLISARENGEPKFGILLSDYAESYLHVVREDPERRGLLYLGGERGLLISWDDGGTWTPLRLNLPTVAVTDLVVKHNDLVVGTNGRSIWILDDLTPLRQGKLDNKDQDTALFPASSAVRYRYHTPLGERKPLGGGDNPPPGALLYYFLKTKPKGDITLEIVEAKNKRVTLLTSKKEPEEKPDPGDYAEMRYKKPVLAIEPGLHRLVWDLRYEGAEIIKGAKVDSGEPRMGPLVNPGVYILKLTVEGKTRTTELRVLPDPRTISPRVWARTAANLAGSDQALTPEAILRRVEWPAQAAELKEQIELTLKIRDDISSLARTVEQIRKVKGQLVARNELLKDDAPARELVKASRDLLPRLDALEEKLHNPKAKVPYDILAQKGGARLYSQLVWLFEMMKDSDGAPTQGIREMYEEQSDLLQKYEEEWKKLVAKELAALNEQAKKLDVPTLLVPTFTKSRR